MTTNLVDVIVQRYGGGWIWDAYAHRTIDPVAGAGHYSRITIHPTAESALAAARQRLGQRIVQERIIR